MATDLDGTILTRNGNGYHPEDIDALYHMGEAGVKRVIATGRPLNSAKKVIPPGFPVDYLVFSSGAGVYDWQEERILEAKHLGAEKSKEIIPLLKSLKLNFTLHWPIPENHCFYFSETESNHADFIRYIDHNEKFAFLLEDRLPEKDYTQVLAFLPDVSVYEHLTGKVSGVKAVRATSPIDGKSVWMEFFHKGVSKAEGLKFICELEKIEKNEVVVLGNDFNDIDMLGAFDTAFVVREAPDELKRRFSVVGSASDGVLREVALKTAIL